VIVAQDARTIRRSATRSAQITVWNVMSLVLKEGGNPGAFQEGQKFLVSESRNLIVLRECQHILSR
jgi:breast cancer 2 susceptibility protein